MNRSCRAPTKQHDEKEQEMEGKMIDSSKAGRDAGEDAKEVVLVN